MAIDSDSNPSTSQAVAIISTSVGKKKRIFRNDCENRYGAIWYLYIYFFLQITTLILSIPKIYF